MCNFSSSSLHMRTNMLMNRFSKFGKNPLVLTLHRNCVSIRRTIAVEFGFTSISKNSVYAQNKSLFVSFSRFFLSFRQSSQDLSLSLSFSTYFSVYTSDLSRRGFSSRFVRTLPRRSSTVPRFVIQHPRRGSWFSWRGSRASRKEARSSCRLAFLCLFHFFRVILFVAHNSLSSFLFSFTSQIFFIHWTESSL